MLDIDDEPATVRAPLIEDEIDHRLKGPKRLATPADEQAEVVASDVDHHRVVGLLDEDLRGDSHLVEKFSDHLTGFDGVALAHRHPHARLLGSLVEDRDLDVFASLLELLERLLDGLLDGLAGGLDAVASDAHAAFPLPRRGGESDPQPVMKYCWPMLNRLLTTQ